ncbi:hypothetical protein Tco_0402704, partial [Tanacetum coccineum]
MLIFLSSAKHVVFGLKCKKSTPVIWIGTSIGAEAVPGFLLPSENVVEKKDDEELA